MKINNDKIKIEKISKLPYGQVILYRDGYYIITDVGYLINLSNGSAISYMDDDIAVTVEAELTIL